LCDRKQASFTMKGGRLSWDENESSPARPPAWDDNDCHHGNLLSCQKSYNYKLYDLWVAEDGEAYNLWLLVTPNIFQVRPSITRTFMSSLWVMMRRDVAWVKCGFCLDFVLEFALQSSTSFGLARVPQRENTSTQITVNIQSKCKPALGGTQLEFKKSDKIF